MIKALKITYTPSTYFLIAISLIFVLNTHVYAQDTLNIENMEMDTTFSPYAEYDKKTGDYTIYYFKDAKTGKMLKSLYVPPTKVDPAINVRITPAQEGFDYHFTIKNGKKSKQSIFTLDLQIKNKFQKISFQDGWYYRNTSNSYIDIVHYGKYPDIVIGDSLLIEVNSNYLPGIISSRLLGREERSSFSFLFSPPNEVYGIIDSLTTKVESDQGIKLQTVGPKIKVDDVELDSFVDTLQSYLSFSCDTTWIENQGTCRSLEVKLDNIERQLEQGCDRTASNNLEALLNEMDALKEKQISSEAYGLLYFNAQFLLEKLSIK